MSDYPQVLGPHIVNLPSFEVYRTWMATHFEQIPEPGAYWIFHIQDEKQDIIKIGDGVHMFGELTNYSEIPNKTKYYKISAADLRELLTAAHQFWALDGGGVDNWMWCGESCYNYLNQYNADQGTDFDDFEDLAKYEMKSYVVIS